MLKGQKMKVKKIISFSKLSMNDLHDLLDATLAEIQKREEQNERIKENHNGG